MRWLEFLPFWRRSEIKAARYLRSQGFRIVASNFRVKEGEVDLIAWESDILVFIEVKSRKTADAPENAVGITKQRRIVKAARTYITRRNLQPVTYRFDVVAVSDEICLIRDAFRPHN